jgi:acetolactate synthase-1/2/3 large subunit
VRGSEVFARLFEDYDVRHVFFVPTILSHTLYEIENAGVTRIGTHSERAAVYMADGYARATRRPGVCMAQAVGAAEIAASLREPFLGCSPVVALTGGATPASRSRQQYQQVEDFSMFGPVTKYNGRAETLDRVPDILRQAFRQATSGKPGPVHVELLGPQAEELETMTTSIDVYGEGRYSCVPPHRPSADSDSVAATVRLLQEAKRPVLVVGGGARWSDAGAQVVALAERFGMPVATSLNAKELMPGGHPLSVGVAGLYARPSANRVIADADLVFFVGSQTSSQVTHSWTIPAADTSVIQLDIDPTELGRHYTNRVSLLGDARTVIEQLLTIAGDAAAPSGGWAASARAHVEEWRSDTATVRGSTDVPLRPERLVDELTHVLPSDSLVVSDTGHAGIWAGGWLDLNDPDQGFIRAAGNLGWAFPAGIGAKVGVGERPVVVFTGDGGFWYHLSELETAVRWNVPVVVVINDNHSMNQEINPYKRAYGDPLHGRHHELWHFADIDLSKVAKEIGALGLRVTEPDQLGGALDHAISARRPTVIDVVTDVDVIAPGVRY